MVRGRGIFQKRQVVDGGLEISVGDAIDDDRLRDWVNESRAVLPMLDAMVKNGHHGGDRLRPALEDLRRRVEGSSARRRAGAPRARTPELLA